MEKSYVCHLTSVHARQDTRILHKECVSLVRAGHRVTLVVADGQPAESIQGVEIRSVPRSCNRLTRMLFAPWRVFREARRQGADFYHLHDPELIPVGLVLKAQGARVVFDSHEDLPKQLRSKPYLPVWTAALVAGAARLMLRAALPWFSGVVAATPAIARSLGYLRIPLITVNNFPLAGELDPGEDRPGARVRSVCYVGGIARIRGAREMIRALAFLPRDMRLTLAGPFENEELERECRSMLEWGRVDYRGWVDRAGVRAILSESLAGLVVFHPSPNHLEAQPNKLFEYMSAGLPIVASDFPLWRHLLGDGGLGICVDPMDPKAIAEAIAAFLDNPEEAKAMGRRGRDAVATRFTWEGEASRLVAFVEGLVR